MRAARAQDAETSSNNGISEGRITKKNLGTLMSEMWERQDVLEARYHRDSGEARVAIRVDF